MHIGARSKFSISLGWSVDIYTYNWEKTTWGPNKSPWMEHKTDPQQMVLTCQGSPADGTTVVIPHFLPHHFWKPVFILKRNEALRQRKIKPKEKNNASKEFTKTHHRHLSEGAFDSVGWTHVSVEHTHTQYWTHLATKHWSQLWL